MFKLNYIWNFYLSINLFKSLHGSFIESGLSFEFQETVISLIKMQPLVLLFDFLKFEPLFFSKICPSGVKILTDSSVSIKHKIQCLLLYLLAKFWSVEPIFYIRNVFKTDISCLFVFLTHFGKLCIKTFESVPLKKVWWFNFHPPPPLYYRQGMYLYYKYHKCLEHEVVVCFFFIFGQNLPQFAAMFVECTIEFATKCQICGITSQRAYYRQAATFFAWVVFFFTLLSKRVSISSKCKFTYDPSFCYILVTICTDLKNICHESYCNSQ